MEMISITNENAIDFADYISEDIQSFLGREFFRGIGIVENYSDAVGALVYELMDYDSEKDVKSHIYSLGVKSDKATDFIMSEYQKHAGEEEVVQSIYESEDKDTDNRFVSHGFVSDKAESPELVICVGELEKILKSAGKRNLPPYIHTLKDVSRLQYREFLKKLLIHRQFGILEDLSYLPMSWFEAEASVCSVADNKIDGIFLIHALPSGTLLPCVFTAFGPDSKKNLGFLLLAAMQRAVQLYEDDTKIVIRRHDDKVKSLTDKLFPDKKGNQVFIGKRAEGKVNG